MQAHFDFFDLPWLLETKDHTVKFAFVYPERRFLVRRLRRLRRLSGQCVIRERDKSVPTRKDFQFCKSAQSAQSAGNNRSVWDERACVMEMMTAFKRAGADLIITYWARQCVEWLKSQ